MRECRTMILDTAEKCRRVVGSVYAAALHSHDVNRVLVWCRISMSIFSLVEPSRECLANIDVGPIFLCSTRLGTHFMVVVEVEMGEHDRPHEHQRDQGQPCSHGPNFQVRQGKSETDEE